MEDAVLTAKITICKEFNKEILDLVNKLQSKFPKDLDIDRVKGLIILAIGTDELSILIEAGSLIFKYRNLLEKLKKGEDAIKLAAGIEELKAAQNTQYGELVGHILKTSFTAFNVATPAEKEELYTKITGLIITYAKFLKLEKTNKV